MGTGHLFLKMMSDIAESDGAPEGIRADFDAALAWMGVESAADLDPTKAGKKAVEAHEKWARGFEAYLKTGTAPSPELHSAFARFKSWLVGVYARLKGAGVEINNDIRGVFDRMLATEEQIAAAESFNRYMVSPEIASLMSQSEEATYRKAAQKASEAMMNAAHNKRARNVLIDAEADRLMTERHGSLNDNLRQAAEAAGEIVFSEQRGRFISLELKKLRELGAQDILDNAAARKVADEGAASVADTQDSVEVAKERSAAQEGAIDAVSSEAFAKAVERASVTGRRAQRAATRQTKAALNVPVAVIREAAIQFIADSVAFRQRAHAFVFDGCAPIGSIGGRTGTLSAIATRSALTTGTVTTRTFTAVTSAIASPGTVTTVAAFIASGSADGSQRVRMQRVVQHPARIVVIGRAHDQTT